MEKYKLYSLAFFLPKGKVGRNLVGFPKDELCFFVSLWLTLIISQFLLILTWRSLTFGLYSLYLVQTRRYGNRRPGASCKLSGIATPNYSHIKLIAPQKRFLPTCGHSSTIQPINYLYRRICQVLLWFWWNLILLYNWQKISHQESQNIWFSN